MAFLTNRVLLWIITSASILGVAAAFYTGALNRGIKLRDELWRTVVERKEKEDRRANERVLDQQRIEDRELKKRIEEIKEKWSRKPEKQ